ncbi:hypothetical protein ABH39_14195 [Mycobacterium haemophilum]|uniref:Uncharacterized protein n=2 Tax=Mycobacterium haemophilum TaxID=29311 RepID=A0A0I9U5J6_9MYCO|nr:hypothetical protein ABH39_14195 [Mycobacterium haemophilum]KLO37456.1 hypothetical protein ABH38_08655 [Mycobacterium haemophilum]
MGILNMTVIIGYMGDQVRATLGNGDRFGVRIDYLEAPDVSRGLGHGISLAREHFQSDPFVTILADELYLDSNHDELALLDLGGCDAVCGISRTVDVEKVRNNYSVQLCDNRIAALIEKPRVIENNVLGCGTYVLTPTIFDVLCTIEPSRRTGRVELTDALSMLARRGTVRPFWLTGTYFNVNTVDDYNHAQSASRTASLAACRVDVIVPAYNEEESIGYVVHDFKEHADEVFVVDNSSHDRTAETARLAGARVETVELRGYGETIRWGLDHARGDILIVVEADGSFLARDLGKLLEYLKNADIVVGTRTNRGLVARGTNMRGPVRWGNILLAKLVQILWLNRQPRFSDVGCTYRALWHDTWLHIRHRVHAAGPEFAPEMTIAALQERQRIIEIPVSYYQRIGGESKLSANYLGLGRTALRMLAIIVARRIGNAQEIQNDAPGTGTITSATPMAAI